MVGGGQGGPLRKSRRFRCCCRLIPSPSLETHTPRPSQGSLASFVCFRTQSLFTSNAGELTSSKSNSVYIQTIPAVSKAWTPIPLSCQSGSWGLNQRTMAVLPKAFSLLSSKLHVRFPCRAMSSRPHTDLIIVPQRASTLSRSLLKCSSFQSEVGVWASLLCSVLYRADMNRSNPLLFWALEL